MWPNMDFLYERSRPFLPFIFAGSVNTIAPRETLDGNGTPYSSRCAHRSVSSRFSHGHASGWYFTSSFILYTRFGFSGRWG